MYMENHNMEDKSHTIAVYRNGLLTTDLSLSFLEAYRIYARRWATEVAYKDCKTLLNFGKCQSVHFAAQIANFTLTMMQYNILCTVKRFEAYETIGGLFTEVTNDTLELSVTDKIWAIILDFVLEAAERYSIDATECWQISSKVILLPIRYVICIFINKQVDIYSLAKL